MSTEPTIADPSTRAARSLGEREAVARSLGEREAVARSLGEREAVARSLGEREAPGHSLGEREPLDDEERGLTRVSQGQPDGGAHRDRPGVEVALVLLVSLGQSAVYSALSLIAKLTERKRLDQQTTSINNTVAPQRPLLDLAYQVCGIVFPLIPALLAVYLLWVWRGRDAWRAIGLDRRRPLFDGLTGVGLAALIGIPGIALYLGARALGLNTTVSPANLEDHWYTFLIYLGLAAMNGALEELVMIGYLFARLRAARWGWVAIVAFSAVVRGSYHLYQGFGGFVGNAIMGVIFGLFFLRYRRVWPLVVAHFLLDAVVYLGYPWAHANFAWLR